MKAVAVDSHRSPLSDVTRLGTLEETYSDALIFIVLSSQKVQEKGQVNQFIIKA